MSRRYFKDEDSIVKAAMEILESRITYTEGRMSDAEESGHYFKMKLFGLKHEVFLVAFLDTGLKLIACEEMALGTLDGASVYPREIARRCLELGAGSVILAHNHPSGNTQPSRADLAITERLAEALKLFDIRVVDHIIAGKLEHNSLRKSSQLSCWGQLWTSLESTWKTDTGKLKQIALGGER